MSFLCCQPYTLDPQDLLRFYDSVNDLGLQTADVVDDSVPPQAIDVVRYHRALSEETFEEIAATMGKGFVFVERYYAPNEICDAPMQFVRTDSDTFVCLDSKVLRGNWLVVRYTGYCVGNGAKLVRNSKLLFVRYTQRIMLVDARVYVDHTRIFAAESGELVTDTYVAGVSALYPHLAILRDFARNGEFGHACECPVMHLVRLYASKIKVCETRK